MKIGVSVTLRCITFICDLLLALAVSLLLGYGICLLIPWIYVLNDVFVATTFIVGTSFSLMISLASIIGCVGAVKKNCGILFGSAAFNTFVLFLLFNFTLCICFTRHSIEDKIKKDMQTSFDGYNRNCTNGYSSPGWDTLQRAIGCCGIDNFTDWESRTGESVPPYSCALEEKRTNQSIDFLTHLRKSEIINYVYNTGCLLAVKQNIEIHKSKLILIAGLFELLIILSITVTCYLGKKVRDLDINHDPMAGHEDYELSRIVRNYNHLNGINKNGSLRSTRSDRIRFMEDSNQNFTNKGQERNFAKAMRDERIINYTKL